MHQKGFAARTLLWVLVALVLVWLAWPWLRAGFVGLHAEPRVVTPRGEMDNDEKATIGVFRAVGPSVVAIATTGRRVDYWTRNVFEVPQGQGSGFIWDEQGHVVTNYHVVRGANRALVRLDDQRAYEAVAVGASPEHDIAVLRIDVPISPPPPVQIGSSADLLVGQKVLAIGNPFGFDRTLTTGIISALDRTLPTEDGREMQHLIQTDAAINPGNSGGPLLDSAGRLIGINTAIYSPSQAYAGIGLAIPVDIVNRVVPQLIAQGKFVRPMIGVQSDDEISKRIGEELGVTGLVILRVTPGSPAERAGLQAARLGRTGDVQIGDVIVDVDGTSVEDLGALTDLLEQRRIGDTVKLKVWREGQQREVDVVLAAP